MVLAPDRLAHPGPPNLVRRAAGVVLDAVLPPQCLSCRAPVDTHGQVCGACWSEIDFIADPRCAACGRPFEYDLGPRALCGPCIAEEPTYGRARSVMCYGDRSRGLVIGFKHGDRTERAKTFGGWMARVGEEILSGADTLVPVPLHRMRLLSRRFNQAAMLALVTGRRAGVPVQPRLLVRTRATPSQGGLNAAERRANVRGAFAVRSGQEGQVGGRRLVLVDDVMTTGATVSACARVLLKAGAAAVDVLTLVQVVFRAEFGRKGQYLGTFRRPLVRPKSPGVATGVAIAIPSFTTQVAVCPSS